jgi:hypothetical protein
MKRFEHDSVEYLGSEKAISTLVKLINGDLKGPLPKDIKPKVVSPYKIIETPYRKWLMPTYIEGKMVVSSVQVYFGDEDEEYFYPIINEKISDDTNLKNYIG